MLDNGTQQDNNAALGVDAAFFLAPLVSPIWGLMKFIGTMLFLLVTVWFSPRPPKTPEVASGDQAQVT